MSLALGLWAVSTYAAPLSPEDAASHRRNRYDRRCWTSVREALSGRVFTAVIYGMDPAKFGTPETALLGSGYAWKDQSLTTAASPRSF